jgi:hypothetical protein
MRNREIWVRIEKNVFEQSAFTDINFIVQILQWTPTDSISRYNFFINTADIETLERLDNYKNLSELDRNLINNQTYYAFTSGKNLNSKYIISNKTVRQQNEFNIEESIRFFLAPVSIILENSLNDSYFLEAIFTHFDPKDENKKRRLIEFLHNDWIQFVNAGGWKNIKNYVDGRLKSLNHFAQNNAENAQKYLRCFVLMDSDRLYPNYTDNDIKRKEELRIHLEGLGVKTHILNKRAMENYMPDEVVKELFKLYGKFKDWAKVYDEVLSVEQKDFLNYEKGFSKKKIETEIKGKKVEVMVNQARNEQSEGIQTLYSSTNINDIQYDIIDTGLKGFPDFKGKFPMLFNISSLEKIQNKENPFLGNDNLINKKTLLQREGGIGKDNEFLEILQKINDLL